MDAILNRLPSVNNCCYFFLLETGCSIIGYLGVIFGIIGFIIDIVDLSAGGSKTAIGISIFQIILTVITTIASVFLVLGVKRKNGSYMGVWILTTLALILLYLIVGIIAICILLFSSFFACLIYVVLNGYFLIVVNTYRNDVETGANVNY
uniref:Unkown protein n=1 Tax=Riptortus pedestris TaxID=329032 RepID=R4WD19_RIPPE|nr:unkown protein [Riptortus pedestris]